MTASMGGEVQSNRLFGAAPESALAGAQALDAEGEDLGDLVEVVGWGRSVWRERVQAFHRGQDSCGPAISLLMPRLDRPIVQMIGQGPGAQDSTPGCLGG